MKDTLRRVLVQMTRAIFIERARCDGDCRRLHPDPPKTSWSDIAARGTGKTMQVSEDDEGTARHRGQPELAVRCYEENCASHRLDGRSAQFDEHVQVDVIMQAAKCSTETPSIPAHTTLAPASNVVVRVENSEAAVVERRDATVVPLQIAQQQETLEVTQMDMEDPGSGTGEVEVGELMTESVPARSDTGSLNASQPTSPKRPKNLKGESRGSRNRNRSRSRVTAMLKQV